MAYSNKCTVVSIYPLPIGPEFKPGINPSDFRIEASDADFTPRCLIVSPATSAKWDYNTNPPQKFENSHSSEEIARAIVTDFKNATFYFPDCSLGLEYVTGEYDTESFLSEQKELYVRMVDSQRKWFRGVVEIASNEWNKTHQTRAIGDIQRIAARLLGMDVEWLLDNKIKIERCPACMTPVPFGAAICAVCKAVVDESKMESIKFATAIEG